VAPEFANYWTVNLESRAYEGTPLPDIYALIEQFRNSHRASSIRNKSAPGTFPAMFQGQAVDEPSPQMPQPQLLTNLKKKSCLCGEVHAWKTCPYIVESIRNQAWTPDPETQKAVEEKIWKTPYLKKIVEGIRTKVKKGEASSSALPPTALGTSDDTKVKGLFPVSVHTAAENSDYHLRDGFILDSGASIHVYNRHERMQALRPAGEDDFVYAGNTTVPIEGFGNVIVTVQAPEGLVKIMLLNVALVPSFHTNITSYDKFHEKGVYWDSERNRLIQGGQTFCTVEWHYGQWTLEYVTPNGESHEATFPAWSVRSA
jgi:hypothetical protein